MGGGSALDQSVINRTADLSDEQPVAENSEKEIYVEAFSPFESVAEEPPSLALIRESGAKIVAYVLVGTFSAVILLTLLICLAIIAKTGSSEHAKLFTDTLVPLFESLGKFVSPVFGPLLAFVLGYYFSKEQAKK